MTYVSTGHLPHQSTVHQVVHHTYEATLPLEGGANSTVYPSLARANSQLFGFALLSVSGDLHEVGDARHEFTMMSVSKPFVYALVADHVGVDIAAQLIGTNATGLPFNSIAAIERAPDGRTNPMVNAGALATTSLIPGRDLEDRWAWLYGQLCAFAGRELSMDDEVLECARETNMRNRAAALLLKQVGAITSDPLEAVELYTRQCCLNVTAVDLASMGCVFADGGLQPITGHQVVSADAARSALVSMTVAGMYEASGNWLQHVGLPGKSGIAGGIMAVSPGKGALGSFSPRLDRHGNSVRGQHAAASLASGLGLDLFASQTPTS